MAESYIVRKGGGGGGEINWENSAIQINGTKYEFYNGYSLSFPNGQLTTLPFNQWFLNNNTTKKVIFNSGTVINDTLPGLTTVANFFDYLNPKYTSSNYTFSFSETDLINYASTNNPSFFKVSSGRPSKMYIKFNNGGVRKYLSVRVANNNINFARIEFADLGLEPGPKINLPLINRTTANLTSISSLFQATCNGKKLVVSATDATHRVFDYNEVSNAWTLNNTYDLGISGSNHFEIEGDFLYIMNASRVEKRNIQNHLSLVANSVQNNFSSTIIAQEEGYLYVQQSAVLCKVNKATLTTEQVFNNIIISTGWPLAITRSSIFGANSANSLQVVRINKSNNLNRTSYFGTDAGNTIRSLAATDDIFSVVSWSSSLIPTSGGTMHVRTFNIANGVTFTNSQTYNPVFPQVWPQIQQQEDEFNDFHYFKRGTVNNTTTISHWRYKNKTVTPLVRLTSIPK
jgi:hypothetical protein